MGAAWPRFASRRSGCSSAASSSSASALLFAARVRFRPRLAGRRRACRYAAPSALFWLLVAPPWVIAALADAATRWPMVVVGMDRAARRMDGAGRIAGALAVARARGDGDRVDRRHRRVFFRPRVRPPQTRAGGQSRQDVGRRLRRAGCRCALCAAAAAACATPAGLASSLDAPVIAAWLPVRAADRGHFGRRRPVRIAAEAARRRQGQRQRCFRDTAACSIAPTRCSRRCRWRRWPRNCSWPRPDAHADAPGRDRLDRRLHARRRGAASGSLPGRGARRQPGLGEARRTVPDASARNMRRCRTSPRRGRWRRRSRATACATRVLAGPAGLADVAALPEVDTVLAAIVGAAGLAADAGRGARRQAHPAREQGSAGHRRRSCSCAPSRKAAPTLLPIDSEHNAIFQCLPRDYDRDPGRAGVRRLLLTASGGPFRTRALAELPHVTPDEACAHPNWRMGRKISVDSATMMNKGLEVIEAHWLFGVPRGRHRGGDPSAKRHPFAGRIR